MRDRKKNFANERDRRIGGFRKQKKDMEGKVCNMLKL